MTPSQSLSYVQTPLRHVCRGLRSSLGRASPHFGSDDRGASAVLGTVLAFGLVISLLAMVQVSAVPAWNQQAEFEHLTDAEADFAALDESVALAADGRTSRATVAGSVTYPTRAFFVSPTPGVGTLKMTDEQVASIDNAVATGETGTYWDGSAKSFDAQSFHYEPSYNTLNQPTLAHEGFAQYTAYANGNETNEVGATQRLVDGTTISLVLLEGEMNTGSADPSTISVTPVSAGTDYITVTDDGTPITISVPTQLSEETWQNLLADEPNVQSLTYTEGGDYNTLTVELRPGRTYDLHISRVGINTAGSDQEPAYMVDVEGANEVVPAGANQRVVVEVRDEQNNPVSNAKVTADDDDGRVFVRGDGPGTTSTVTDSNGRATFVYRAQDSLDGVVSDEFDISVENSSGTEVDRMTFEVQVRENGVADPVRGLVANVYDPGYVYAESADGSRRQINDTGTGGDVVYDAGSDRLVVPPSVSTITADESVTLRGEGVSLHTDVITYDTDGDITVEANSGSFDAVGVSLTAGKNGDITVSADETVDLTGASVNQLGKGDVSITAGGDITLDSAGMTAVEPGEELSVESTGGFVSARNADLSSNGDVVILGETGVDLAGAGISSVKDNDDVVVESATGGINLNGVVMLADGDIDIDAETNVYVVGANIASSKGSADVVITADTGMVSGREPAISAKGDITITAATRISIPDASLDADGDLNISAPEEEY
ncbi:hypothetical protein ACFQJC_02905 [Haloferax namakaokahaiae]|uniref:Big-1 domain-containing protein n=1 Tax=Haloferax namakaokahaiae TaxID=1748331 RepID=A0ABD5ZC08_9EURY